MATEIMEIGSPIDLEDSLDDHVPYSTPITSPEVSPIRRLAKVCITTTHLQLDGVHGVPEATESECSDDEMQDVEPETAQHNTTRPTPPERSSRLQLWPSSSHSKLRQVRFVNGINFPDRFIPARDQTPTKERLALFRPAVKGLVGGSTLADIDPFAPPAQHSLRLNQYFTVTRYPSPVVRPHGLEGTSVQRREDIEVAVSWTVGGVPVTEGIISTTNGRGGRITSSTNAPLFNADMLDPKQISDELTILGNRLAVAMGLNRDSKIIKVDRSISQIRRAPTMLEDIVTSGQRTVWKESRWQTNRPPLGEFTSSNYHLILTCLVTTKRTRDIPALPFKVLDAPNLRNDYYCSLLAYSTTLRCLAVGLGKNVYLWTDRRVAREPGVLDSIKFPDHYGHVTTLAFSSASGGKSILAIGCADGRLTLWNPKERGPRLKCDQPSPISHISFRPCPAHRASDRDPNIMIDTEELLIGTECGRVLLYSLEWPNQHQCELFDWTRSMELRTIIDSNDQQICGIAWSAQGEMVAIGGNDNLLFVYDFDKLLRNEGATTQDILGRARAARQETPGAALNQPVVLPGVEKQRFTLNAAVKAIAFAPWQPSLLAASGGSNDRCIHFLHTHSGATLATVNCHAQVTSLVWNQTRKEIAATLGFAQPDHPYRVVVFAWPSCRQVARIPWPGEERALYGIPFPGGPVQGRQDECIVIATSDHSIKFHEIWLQEKKRCKQSASHAKSQILNDMCSEALENEMQIR